ncbi:hypothetical protein GDO78_011675 [Eleutherodactylus coqui]|uniref:Uncharacterized protein n=1 Tax=Eleutherodactylus coqui TaxID=57060 RepID=A0A8J6F115_ELECQ|nr:hypothetical protein GDO78_011675 [Eleutherodactylus coqui]
MSKYGKLADFSSRFPFFQEVTWTYRSRYVQYTVTALQKIWKSKDISIATKTRLVNAIVFHITMYGYLGMPQRTR